MKSGLLNHPSRPTTHREGSFFKKGAREQAFFGATAPASFFNTSPTVVQRKCDKCLEEDNMAQRKEAPDSSPASSSVPAAVSAVAGSGQPLPADLADHFGQRIGHDFGQVQIHTGSTAAEAAKSISAKAYTLGTDIVFGAGQFQPHTYEGRKLLAHELAHVVQQDTRHLNRESEAGDSGDAGMLEEELPSASTGGVGTSTTNKVAFGDCQGVTVQGRTVANYDHGSYSVSGAAVTRATDCAGCTGDDCVTIRGTIASVFQANPVVTLPSVPSGLNACEQEAVQNFIDTTLSQHEQLHVNAFNTYNATVNTRFNYRGCRDGMDAHVAGIHNGIDASRIASANALSDALDANGANQFTITCDCPDPEPESGS